MTMFTTPAEPPGATRPPAVAGLFYPARDDELRQQVDDLLHGAGVPAQAPVPKALIAPHAGYVYSGPVAATAYARLAPAAGRIRRVVLLGPVHRVAVRGLALPGVARCSTPLGEIAIDAALADAIRDLPQVLESPRAHAPEHSLEVQLPFLQRALGRFTLLPLAVGDATAGEVAQVLDRVWGGDETLIVVSSDLSHYLPYDAARAADRASVDTMLALDARLDHQQACGATPVNGLLLAARRRGLRIELLDLRNSGDTAGDRSRVVGYAALALYEPPATARGEGADARGTAATAAAGALAASGESGTAAAALDARGPILLAQARTAIAAALGLPHEPAPDAPFLHAPGATFVTLKCDGELRGCVGALQPVRALGVDVRHNACAAAFDDTRFLPLLRAEYARLAVEVSVLGPAQDVPAADEADLLRQLQPGVDGLTIAYRGRRATFLPQVWEQLAEPREFLRQLKRKAGLSPDFWSIELQVSRYTVEKFAEQEPPWATH
jgi:AmmeMemoRadiSam system protein B/AmmeMemoRadiSam system protein A